MIQFILSIYDKLIARRGLAILLLLIVLAGCIGSAFRMHYKEDIAEFLPQDAQSKKYSAVYNNVGRQNKIVLLFSTDSLNCENDLIEAMDSFESYWAATDSLNVISDMQMRIEDTQITSVIEFVYENIPYFLEKEDFLRIDSLLESPDYIAQQLENNKKLLMLPTSGFMIQSLRYDPLHLFSPVMQKLQSLNMNSQYQIIDGYIFNGLGNQSLAFFSSPYGMSESKHNEELVRLIDVVAKKIQEENPTITISAIGAPLIAVSNAQQIKKDGFIAVALAISLIFTILILAFRRFDDIFWIGFSILFGCIFALGCIALFKGSISIIVLGIGSVILGIAVNYPLHFLDHLKHEHSKRIALKEMINPLLIGNITTVSAFLCLVFLDAEAMRDLGLFGSLTLIGTIVFVLIFLPVLVERQKKQKNYLQFNFDRFAPVSNEVKRKLFIPVVLITVVLFYFSLNTSFESDMNKINYMTTQQRFDMKTLSQDIQAGNNTHSIFAVAEGNDLQQALQHNEELLKSLKQNIFSEKIVKIEGINNLIPSLAHQEENLKCWSEFWTNNFELISEFEQECSKQGYSEKAFTPFVSSIRSSFKPEDVSYFDPLMILLNENFILETESGIQIVNYVHSAIDTGDELKAQLKTVVPTNSYVFDSKDVSNQLVSMLSDNFNYIGLVCGFVVFFFLWLSFGRIELAFLSFLPLAVSWVWILGIMQILGIQFNIVNIILATFIFGQGDDYTIFITEGMTYEYAYGKKVLKSYKNSVAVSALIMFLGIGVLIFAKHPAMKSLAEVAIIGMIAVVVMTYYLPSLVFNWITKSKNLYRDVPLTLKRIGYSLFSFCFFLFGSFFYILPIGFLYFLFGKTEKKRLKYHKHLCDISRFVINRVPGTSFLYENKYNEQFDKPAIIICNHQSHLDLMCLMMLTPKLILLTNDWVWNNPLYGHIIRWAEFYPVSDGVNTNLERMKSLVDRGYSIVVFPEGTRSEDCSIRRFHQGAFFYAKELQLDILPVFIHGVGKVLPKKDFMLREGNMYLEVGERMNSEEVASYEDVKKLTSYFSNLYRSNYKTICERCETAEYYIPYVRCKYMYKGRDIESRSKKILGRIDIFAPYIDRAYSEVEKINVINSGQGEFAWLLALVHKNIEIYAYEASEDLHLIASNGVNIPDNLHFQNQMPIIADDEIVIDVASIETQSIANGK